ncbi:hypothetical protein N7468_008308 [Penicillium chermesinum]|uniref:Uncharacterized protein n=1 Tax=Penicillium chermesinum TaxID=63820 RepID=A0A9W9NPT8_9EURO|nr:uncharacterized protein N7468_008308 [Penicillium chermesinum]KAJ5223766.1 hypothetical protein N7468_008308 [Penicillium chermesinum]
MATGFSPAPRKEGTWTKLVIFIAIYCLIFCSLLQLVLVFILYGNHQVDSKMTPSLVLSLVSSVLSIPLISLQSLVAWQYNKIGGFGQKKTVLHNCCTYVLRIDLMMWLAASVSGLIVAAQQVYCLPSGTHEPFWRVGVSCAFHRSTVIVSVVSLVVVCTMYCAREMCDRPYDVSIIGIYRRPQALRNGSILSGNSWDSDETLKNEILNLCRQHDGKANGEPWFVDPLINKVNCHPSIRRPAPVRVRPQLRVNTDPGSECGEIRSGVSLSPDEHPYVSPGAQTLMRLLPYLSDINRVPKVPAIPEQFTAHKRQKSSLSSLKRFLPKSLASIPLSSDPQIRALADPDAASDPEKQVAPLSVQKGPLENTEAPAHETSPSPDTASAKDSNDKTATKQEGHARTMTMNSADAPEVVTAPEPAKVRRSQTADPVPAARSMHHPHHPNYTPGAPTPRTYSFACRQNTVLHTDPSRRTTTPRQPNAMPYPVRSTTYQFEQPKPRHTQSQYHSQYYLPPPRWASLHTFDPKYGGAAAAAARRSDVEVIYPSTRRARSSTHGGLSGPLSCIMESSTPRASVDETQLAAITAHSSTPNIIDSSTYRGANRTSLGFY